MHYLFQNMTKSSMQPNIIHNISITSLQRSCLMYFCKFSFLFKSTKILPIVIFLIYITSFIHLLDKNISGSWSSGKALNHRTLGHSLVIRQDTWS